jgi:N-acetylglucosamine kinase-like BadF-type ATPase
MRYFLGIDTGSTKSHALIADESGQVRGFAESGRGNPYNFEAFSGLLQEITQRALQMAGLVIEQIAGAGLGIGGYDWPSQRPEMDRAFLTTGASCPFEFVNDAMLALFGGAQAGWGVAVVAGTSCNAWGRDRAGRYGRMTGFSWLGENAGSSELVHKAMVAVALEWTRRGPATRLSQALTDWYGLKTVEEMFEELTLRRRRVESKAAPLVFEVAAQGDAVAQELICWAGRELGSQAVGIIHQLELEGEAFEVICGGSFFKGSPVVLEELARTVHAAAPGAQVLRLEVPPVAGGVMLGMSMAGAHTNAARLKVIDTFARLAPNSSAPSAG